MTALICAAIIIYASVTSHNEKMQKEHEEKVKIMLEQKQADNQ